MVEVVVVDELVVEVVVVAVVVVKAVIVAVVVVVIVLVDVLVVKVVVVEVIVDVVVDEVVEVAELVVVVVSVILVIDVGEAVEDGDDKEGILLDVAVVVVTYENSKYLILFCKESFIIMEEAAFFLETKVAQVQNYCSNKFCYFIKISWKLKVTFRWYLMAQISETD